MFALVFLNRVILQKVFPKRFFQVHMTPREFALEVVLKLQHAGYQALWAGGCVRDQLMGAVPKDYDVATDATPQQVRDLFGKKKTLPIGVSFGVISVKGPRSAGHIEVATFRREAEYSDGRRPDAVEFTDAKEDALRRDFTINGMFFDPIDGKVIDYVGGQEDLSARVIRAIGNPEERIAEDKLRMLRGVRFASTYEFDLETETLKAIREHAVEISTVSGERIGAEMRRMLTGSTRATAARLLRESGLLAEILHDGNTIYADDSTWQETLESLQRLSLADFASAAEILLEVLIRRDGIQSVFDGWKLSNDESKSITWIARYWQTLDQADELPWSQIQPLLLAKDVERALAVAEARAGQLTDGVTFCRARLQWSAEQLNPAPFLDGQDLIKLGIERGPKFKLILDRLRSAQLDQEVTDREMAVQMAQEWAAE